MKSGPRRRSPGERALGRWRVDTKTDCWNWTGGRFNHGYGAVSSGGRNATNLLAHRVVYEHYKGPIPAGLDACHRCDNKLCVNPEHIFLGTAKDNIRDMIVKGRGNWSRGEKHYAAKLDDVQVKRLRELAVTGKYSQSVLAATFDICQSHVSALIRGEKRNARHG